MFLLFLELVLASTPDVIASRIPLLDSFHSENTQAPKNMSGYRYYYD